MPWKETCFMDERVRFIAAVAEAEDNRSESFASVCRRFGISRRAGYKWVKRYERDGVDGLRTSREPRTGALIGRRITCAMR